VEWFKKGSIEVRVLQNNDFWDRGPINCNI